MRFIQAAFAIAGRRYTYTVRTNYYQVARIAVPMLYAFGTHNDGQAYTPTQSHNGSMVHTGRSMRDSGLFTCTV